MASTDSIQEALRIIGEAINVDPDDFLDHESWKFLGLGDLLASATISDLKSQIDLDLPSDVFNTYTTVGAFKTYLSGDPRRETNINEPTDPWEGVPKPKVPLSIVLQGHPSTSATTIFLFPDGSGAGTSYNTLPPIGDDVCLIGLNSPFLRQADSFTCSIERMARLWIGELRKLQPKGKPYVLGGWSAGGYYAFEAAKLLIAAGERVQRMIIIDSPCRLVFEALPEQVVQELTRKGLMGASKEKKAPEWLVQHFTSTVSSVERYMPTPIAREHVPPNINFIWVKEGLVGSVAASGLEVDLNVKVTKFLLEPRGDLQTEGWEILLPGAQYNVEYMTGNHFQITQPPHSESLGAMLRKAIKS